MECKNKDLTLFLTLFFYFSSALCTLLKTSSPKIYKDQLLGARQILNAYIEQYGEINAQLLSRLIDTPRLTATGLRDRLAAFLQHSEREKPEQLQAQQEAPTGYNNTDDSLARYSELNDQPGGQGESHVFH
jgi:hypothetical protein